MGLFDLFTTTSYTFLQLESGDGGNKEVEETIAQGIVKHRNGMTQEAGRETYTAQTTIHIKPEPFVSALGGVEKLVGHGIRADGVDYRIDGARPGRDFENGSDEFYILTLKKEALWVESNSPLV